MHTQKDWDIIQEQLDYLQEWRTGNGVKSVWSTQGQMTKSFALGSLIGNTKGERNAHQMAIEKANVILECFRLNISVDKKVWV